MRYAVVLRHENVKTPKGKPLTIDGLVGSLSQVEGVVVNDHVGSLIDITYSGTPEMLYEQIGYNQSDILIAPGDKGTYRTMKRTIKVPEQRVRLKKKA